MVLGIYTDASFVDARFVLDFFNCEKVRVEKHMCIDLHQLGIFASGGRIVCECLQGQLAGRAW